MSRRLICVAVVLLWLYGWLPSLFSLALTGRGDGNALVVTPFPLAEKLAGLLLYALLAVLVTAVALSLTEFRDARPGGGLLAVAAWSVIYPLHGEMGVSTLAFPLFAAAWFLAKPDPRTLYKVLAWIGVMSALVSLALAGITPLAFMSASWNNADKALIAGKVLAGPYSHSNALGLAVVLTLPLVVLHFRGTARVLALSAVLLTLVWSASRISVGVAIVGALVCFVGLSLAMRAARRTLVAGALLALALLVGLPLMTNDPYFLTDRGRIWITAREFSSLAPWGMGGSAFREQNQLTESLGQLTSTGHNAFVTLWLTGGAPALVFFSVIICFALARGRRAYGDDPGRLIFLVILLGVSIAEDPVRALLVGPQAFVIYPMLFALLAAVPSATRTDDSSESHEKSVRPDESMGVASAHSGRDRTHWSESDVLHHTPR